MKTRMFLFATTLLMMAAGAGFGSCAQSDGVLNTNDSQQTDKPYSTFTVPDVQFERNKITTIKGQYFNHQSGISMSLNTEWSEKGFDVEI